MDELKVIHATTFFSLGIERLLKFYYFCGLKLQDYEEMNYVGADSIIKGGFDVA